MIRRDELVYLATAASIGSFLTAYNSILTSLVTTASAILVLRRLWLIFIKDRKHLHSHTANPTRPKEK